MAQTCLLDQLAVAELCGPVVAGLGQGQVQPNGGLGVSRGAPTSTPAAAGGFRGPEDPSSPGAGASIPRDVVMVLVGMWRAGVALFFPPAFLGVGSRAERSESHEWDFSGVGHWRVDRCRPRVIRSSRTPSRGPGEESERPGLRR